MSNKVKSPLMKKAPTYSLRASIISILIGLLTGAVVILIVGAFNPLISLRVRGTASGWCSLAC